jgi:cytochrome bd-type quinol oxidase subunit 2
MMELLAIVVLGFYATAYFVLGGADIGAGMLIPFLGRTRAHRRHVVAAIVPFFLINEVWLIAAAGLLVGLFPSLEGELLSGLFPLFVALLIGWIGRDAGVWFRGRIRGDGRGGRVWRAGCDTTITVGSWIVAGSWAWIVAGLLAGSTHSVVTEPAAIAPVIAVMAVFALHGLAFVGLRTDGELRRTAVRWFGASNALGTSGASGAARAFALTAAAMAALLMAAGSRLALSETVAATSTLGWLVPAVLIVTPFLLAGQVWAWRLFGQRVVVPGEVRAASP